MKKTSIGLRLTLWYVVVFSLAQLIFGFSMWLILRQNLYGLADDALKNLVDDLVHFFQAQKKNATVGKLQEEVAEAYVIEHSGDYLQLYDADGNCIFRAESLQRNNVASPSADSVRHAIFSDRTLDGQPFRLVTQRFSVNGRTFIAQTAVVMTDSLKTLSLFRHYLLLFAPVLLLIAACGGYCLSRRALAPVDALTRTAQKISGSNLNDRLQTLTTGDELQRLSDTLNQMLTRIEGAFLQVTQFTADASHELRTPISLIRTEAEIALRKPRASDDYREALRHILLEAEKTSSLLEELLALARADAGRETLRFAKIDLRSVIAGATEEWRHLLETRGFSFTQTLSAEELTVMADTAALQRLLSILLDNAVKYTPSPGSIALRLEKTPGTALLTLQDSGIGIAEENHLKIFERFYRVDKARSREMGGSGIGLAIADWIVQQHGGRISVESRLGSGSSFIVQFPLAEHQVGSELILSTLAKFGS